MKITKRQLRQIIKEEKARLLELGPKKGANDLESAVYAALGQYLGGGVSENEAADMVLNDVRNILGY